MNAKFLLATLAIAAAATGVARADEIGDSQYAIQFEGQRTRAEVMAEAAAVPRIVNLQPEPAGPFVVAPAQSSVDARAVRAEAVEALRLGKIPSGDVSL